MSTGELYVVDLKMTYGALYHLVDTYYVNGGLALIYLAKPKSAIFTIPLHSNKFYGFISR